MPTIALPKRSGSTSKSEDHHLPAYADELAAFHLAFSAELRELVGCLPLSPEMRVLDIGCGDGFYMQLFAERLMAPGGVTGLDRNPAYLAVARERITACKPHCIVNCIEGRLDDFPIEQGGYDLVWCAQSLYSLAEPVRALRQMAAAARRGGFVAVLENDTLHQLLLPWPNDLELALREAELKALRSESSRPDRYYIGRRLPALLADAGIEPLGFKTQCIDRREPIDSNLQAFLQAYFARLTKRVLPYLDPGEAQKLSELIDPSHDAYLFHQPHLTVTWLNMLAWGRRP